MIATRKNDGNFKMVARTSDLEYSLDIDSDTTDMDVRLVAIRKDGKYLSNILSYSINSETGEENQDKRQRTFKNNIEWWFGRNLWIQSKWT